MLLKKHSFLYKIICITDIFKLCSLNPTRVGLNTETYVTLTFNTKY